MSEVAQRSLLPKGLEDVDATFMTHVLRNSGVIAPTNEVTSLEEQDVGMTAGYLSAIKKIKCAYREATDAQASFVVKTWPAFEMAPKETMRALFMKDIGGYQLPPEHFFPRPHAYLAAFDAPADRWVLLMEDADTFAEHKVHENEMRLDEVLKMIPRLVDVAVAWEGCHTGDKAEQCAALGVNLWASDENLAVYKELMPRGAKLFDKWTTIEGSSVVGAPTWDKYLGGFGFGEMLTRRLDAFFESARPSRGATCTLTHGDLRGDNVFFCDGNSRFADGWLCIDFQLMFRGPVPSDLAYLMSSGSVLPGVYTGDNMNTVLGAFYDRFMSKTQLYTAYTYEQFRGEYVLMTTILLVYTLAFGAAIMHEGAFRNAMGARIELGDQGATEADLSPEERRQRMWWGKLLANFRENFKTFRLYEYLRTLPENLDGLGIWTELPDHLRG